MRFVYQAFWPPFYRRQVEIQHFNVSDHIYKTITHSHCFYEQDLLYFLAFHIKKGGSYIDVGANIGNHSLFFALFKADHVVAVEPDPNHVKCLSANMTLNAIHNISIHPVAVSSQSGQGYIYLDPQQSDNCGMTQVVHSPPSDNPVSVKIQTLDELLAALSLQSPCLLLKVDAEGMDYEVLCGAEKLLQTQQPVVIFESLSDALFQRIHAYLLAFDYQQVAQFGHPPTYVYQSAQNPLIRPKIMYQPLNFLRRVHRKIRQLFFNR